MEHYVGLDVSLRLTAICIVDRTGRIEREGVVASDPEAIAAFVKSHAPQVARIGLETGATSTLSLSQMSSGWRGRTNRVMLWSDVGRLQIALVAAHRVIPIARVT